MDRRTAAALITAGVVGVTGGTAAAVLRDPGPGSAGGASGPSATGTPRSTPRSTPGSTAGSSPRSTPSTTPSPSASATPRPRAATVLYAAGGKIHDGATTVGWTAPFRFVRGLTRIPDGYLVAFSGTESEPGLELWKVRPDGTSTKLAAVVGDWDLSPDRTRVVGLATAGLRLTVWSVDDGSVVRVWRKFAYTVSPAFAGDDVVVDPVTPDGTTDLVSWNPDTGRAGRLTPSGLAGMTASLDGRRLAGSIGVDGRTNSQEGTPCLGAARYPAITDVGGSWQTCDWSPYGGSTTPVSPDGTTIWAVPSGSDGFGPTQVATFSAAEGPTVGLRRFNPPAGTYDATWLDDDHLLLTGAVDPGQVDESTGTWLRTCDLSGRCTEVARVPRGRLVAGVLK